MKITLVLKEIQMPPLFEIRIIGLKVAIDIFFLGLVMKDGSFMKVYVNV